MSQLDKTEKLGGTLAVTNTELFATTSRTYFALKALFIAILAVLGQSNAAQALDAFPGAAGHGSQTQGGRGGDVLFVTNLQDSGPGSFRACAERTGKRNCLFRVGGIIHLKKPIGILAGNSNLSVLGQSAPGGGITLTIDPQNKSPFKTPFYIKDAHDVLVRHLRVRLQYAGTVRNADAFTVETSQRVYIDHVSGSWATDEVISTYQNATDLTIAYSIFGEGIMPHSKCALLGSNPTQPQNITFWRNACVSNNDRNPDNHHLKGSCVEIANNIFFNARSEWAEVFSQYQGGIPVSFLNNYFKAGKNTSKSTYAIIWQDIESVAIPTIFQKGNVTWAPKPKTIELFEPQLAHLLVTEPPCLNLLPLNSAEDAYKDVRINAGAFPRDAVDTRLIHEIGSIGRKGDGSIKTVPGEIPAVQINTNAYADRDDDGIADANEKQFGGNDSTFDSWSDFNNDGWSNFDEFMQWLSEERIAGRYPK